MLTYDNLPYMDYARIDEFRWLAEQIVAGMETRGEDQSQIMGVKRSLADAKACAARGDRKGEAQHCIKAYQVGADVW